MASQQFKHTLLAGMLFAVPVGIIAYVIGKMLSTVETLVSPIAQRIGIEHLLGEFTLIILALLVFLGFCWLLGWLVQRALFLQEFGNSIENFAVRLIPSLSIIKSMATEKLSAETESRWKGVLLEEDGAWQPAFMTEETEQWQTFFIPDAPKGDAGSLRTIPKGSAQIKLISIATVHDLLRLYGGKSSQHLD